MILQRVVSHQSSIYNSHSSLGYLAVKEFLHVPINIFIDGSVAYDPLTARPSESSLNHYDIVTF